MFHLLAQQLASRRTIQEKIIFLAEQPVIKEFFLQLPELISLQEMLSEKHKLILYSLLAAGQGERLLTSLQLSKLEPLFDQLDLVEKCYASIGGLIGYHAQMVELLNRDEPPRNHLQIRVMPPQGISIAEETPEVREVILAGIQTLPLMAEMYPLGGAADRLRLYDERTGSALPAARLTFLGKTLLEGLIADLQSREYLYYKLFGQQLITPVAIMTSLEKNNHQHIVEICEEAGWFGRSKEMFRLFCQPLVPTINKKGEWCLQGPQQLLMKPGGHGVIWRLAQEEGVLEWFQGLGRKKIVVRQVNNPVANTDYGLVAFTGIGCRENYRFGFASCPRLVKASEGMNVLIEAFSEEGTKYTLTNIEYCDFKKLGIQDVPEKPGSLYSKFPSNTNILFVDILAILEATLRSPIPGILMNMKKVTYRTTDGIKKEEEVARLESTMQNIADFFEEVVPNGTSRHGVLRTYLTYNQRRKTISAAKREFTLGSSLLETPEGCFLDILQNVRDLLTSYCLVEVPLVNDPLQFFEKGPSFIVLYHPALGPLYSVIAQKWRGGKICLGGEVQLQIAEMDFENLVVEGSFLVQAEALMGHYERDLLSYSERVGRCVLKNVSIVNKGIDHEFPNVYWKNEIARQEACQIVLRGLSEFHAENITLKGDYFIEVPHGFLCRALEIEGKIEFQLEKIETPSWHWEYTVAQDESIHLKKVAAPNGASPD